MKVLLDIKDNKAAFFMELLKSFSYVKAQPVNTEKEQIKAGIKEAVAEMNQILAGKKKGRPAEALFNEL